MYDCVPLDSYVGRKGESVYTIRVADIFVAIITAAIISPDNERLSSLEVIAKRTKISDRGCYCSWNLCQSISFCVGKIIC